MNAQLLCVELIVLTAALLAPACAGRPQSRHLLQMFQMVPAAAQPSASPPPPPPHSPKVKRAKGSTLTYSPTAPPPPPPPPPAAWRRKVSPSPPPPSPPPPPPPPSPLVGRSSVRTSPSPPPPGVVSSSAPSSSNAIVPADALGAHNKFRALHGAAPLTWDASLATAAQHWGNQCYWAHSALPYGENLALGFSSIELAIAAWYAEVCKYSWKAPGFGETTGHFTQLVWKSSGRVGCSVSACSGGVTPEDGSAASLRGAVYVCEYSTPGNYEGEFAYNVPQPLQALSQCPSNSG